MKHYFAALALFAAVATPASAETRDLSGFTSVTALDRLRVEVDVGPVFRIDIQGRDAARVQTRLTRPDTLEIRHRNRPWFGSGPRLDAVVHVTMPAVEGVAAANGAELTAALSGDCQALDAVAAMGGVTRVTGIACRTVDATAAMGGELHLAGTCGALDVTAAMGGDVNARGLRCDTVDATAAMGGDISSYANNTYGGTATMGGSVDVAGEGRRGDATAVMGGSIDHAKN